jgi:hypothetical protein
MKNKLPITFAESKQKFAVSTFRLQQTKGNSIFRIHILKWRIFIYIFFYLYFYIYINIYAAVSNGKRKMETQAIFLNPFTVCSSWKRKFVLCPFENGLNRLNRLARLWQMGLISLVSLMAVTRAEWKLFATVTAGAGPGR